MRGSQIDSFCHCRKNAPITRECESSQYWFGFSTMSPWRSLPPTPPEMVAQRQDSTTAFLLGPAHGSIARCGKTLPTNLSLSVPLKGPGDRPESRWDPQAHRRRQDRLPCVARGLCVVCLGGWRLRQGGTGIGATLHARPDHECVRSSPRYTSG